MNIDVKSAKAVQEAVDKVVQGAGVRFTAVSQNFSGPMARVEAEQRNGSVLLHIRSLNINDIGIHPLKLQEMETIGNGLHFVASGQEYTIYPFDANMAPSLVEAGLSYDQRVKDSKQHEADTYARMLKQSEQMKNSQAS